MKVILNQTQRDYLCRNFLKLGQSLKIKDKEEERRQKRFYRGLAEKFSGPAAFTEIKPHEKEAVLILTRASIKSLEERIIPEYEKRGEDSKEYLERAQGYLKEYRALVKGVENAGN